MSTLEDKDKDNQKENGYKAALKSTSIYGGVQLVTIVISIIRSKLTALWLGTMGFGILSILNSTVTLVATTSNLGLSSSAVRDISKATSSQDFTTLSKVITAISRCVIMTGLVGAIFMVLFAPKISLWTFDSYDYTYAYVALSVVVLMNNVYSGHYAILQGLRRIRYMAAAKIIGAILGLLIIIPCYYFLGVKGIIPSLLLSSLSALLISKYFTLKVSSRSIKQSIKETFVIGKSTIKLGAMMMATGFAANIAELIIKTFITKYGSLEEVGLYQAGWSINTQYLGLVFTAMATDYYPRLTQNFQNKCLRSVNQTINEQSEIALLILAPLICAMVVFLPLVISVLYTSDFITIVPMTRLLLIGSLIKAGSWAVSFLFLAAGDGKTYLINEIGIKLFNIPLYLICYYHGGLLWVGYGFILNYVVYFSWVSYIAYKKYLFKHSLVFVKVLFANISLCALSYLLILFIDSKVLGYSLGALLIVLSGLYSIFELDRRIGLTQWFLKFINRSKK